MIPQYEFTFAREAAVERYYKAHEEWREIGTGIAQIAANAIQDDPPVMARIWVIDCGRVVQRMWRVDNLRALNNKVWGWHHLKGGVK